jgi:hypothetical protein
MRKLVLILSVLVGFTAESMACSIHVNEMFIKNDLVARTASEFGINLSSVTRILTENYNYQLVGVVPGSSCEKYLVHKADITLSYSPRKFENCELKVEAVLKEDLHATSFPFQIYEFNLPTSSCRITRPVIGRPVPGRPLPGRPIPPISF